MLEPFLAKRVWLCVMVLCVDERSGVQVGCAGSRVCGLDSVKCCWMLLNLGKGKGRVRTGLKE